MFKQKSFSQKEKTLIGLYENLIIQGVENPHDPDLRTFLLTLSEKELIILRDNSLFLSRDELFSFGYQEEIDFFYNFIEKITGARSILFQDVGIYYLVFQEVNIFFPVEDIFDFNAALNSVLDIIGSESRVVFSNLPAYFHDVMVVVTPDQLREYQESLVLEQHYRVYDQVFGNRTLADLFYPRYRRSSIVYL